MTKKETRGGRRLGSGRKALPDTVKKVQVTITITQDQRADMESLKRRGVDVNQALGKELNRLAIAYDLVDFGII